MKSTIVNGKTYKYTVLPNYDFVKAEIFYTNTIKDNTYDSRVLSKDFGSSFRKPIEEDYIKAKQWAENQIQYIHNANHNL